MPFTLGEKGIILSVKYGSEVRSGELVVVACSVINDPIC